MADCSAIKARLDSAIAARDRLIAGEQVVLVVDAFRSRVEYKPADYGALTTQIALLQVEYDQCINPAASSVATRPIQFLF